MEFLEQGNGQMPQYLILA